MADVCFWHLADMPSCAAMSAFGVKRTWLSHRKMSAYDLKQTSVRSLTAEQFAENTIVLEQRRQGSPAGQ